MQDRYAGDVGDFLKLGLLRHLARAPGVAMSVGLNWYLVADETHNADGKHVAYLDPANPMHGSLAACDLDLMRRLARVVRNTRSVAELEACGSLPAGSPTHTELLDPALGRAGRRGWHGRALDALADAEVVCVDPDNGISSATGGPKRHKYALVQELADYARRGQSLIAYQHADRSADAETQARRRLAQLAAGVGQPPAGALIARRGSCRFFLVTGADAHRPRLLAGLRDFATRWERHVDLVR